ncbi:thioesterase-like superfamily-domain-containing protein [Plectosphaerella cucumerina]|uniref:Thioesterase-like superfamily-domain-containing protein n=1 Tax=Plectosphaerella cucumerina TaxID=40658 RepID=A0A8K0XA85_9PEZI|nr:thioesterase-like superfamily-domain-containing protein [Plectosphaerella cucumerina]
MAEPLATKLAVERIGDDEFLSKALPVRMGNVAPIAYGGSTLGIAVNAALATVPSTHRLYSLLGHYLGPASIEQHLQCKVIRTRSTATFATRRVEVRQAQKDGSLRLVLEIIADFQVIEEAKFTYNAKPLRTFASVADSKPDDEVGEALLAAGKITQKQLDIVRTSFAANRRHFETRIPPESLSGQTYNGIAKGSTTQDHLDMTERASGDWVRSRDEQLSDNDQVTVLSFFMDGGLAFLPLAHSGMFLNEAGACSSLDIALRLYQPKLDMREWHFRERNSTVAGHGRTYTEARLWDEKGNVVASMTQQGILRPKKVKASI